MPTVTASGRSTASDAATAGRSAIAKAQAKLTAPASYGFVFAGPKLDLGAVLKAAASAAPGVQLVGCTTAGEVTDEGLQHDGVAVLLVASDEHRVAIDYTTQAKVAAGAADDLRKGASSVGAKTTVLLVDGLTGTGETIVDSIQKRLGTLHEIVGGAAGDEGKFAGTWVGAQGKAATGAGVALHVGGPRRWGVGVDHGLSAATKTMPVTAARGNVVHEIDGRPAFDVYRDYAKQKGVELTRANAPQFLINNELGIVMFDALKKARAPLSVGDDGSLSCAAEVPKGAGVCILDGSRRDLVAAARRAALEARERLGGARPAGVLLFDCICRGAILGEDFDQEVRAIRDVFPGVPMAGFLTYGEIARYSGRLDGWHNTTAVVAAIPA